MNVLQSIAAALTPQGLLWTVVLMGLAVFLHELAHYAMARWQGVTVHSFSIGMGPVILKKSWLGTEWRLSLLPLGGYVEIDGMTPEQDTSGEWKQPQRGFTTLAPLGKIAVLLAGPLMNLLLAILLMTTLFSTQGVPVNDRILVNRVLENSLAEKMGLQTGDVIVALDGKAIPKVVEVNGRRMSGWQSLSSWLKQSGQRQLTRERDGQLATLKFDWQPTKDGKKQLLGVSFGPDSQKANLWGAFSQSLSTTAEAAPQIVGAFAGLLQKFMTLDMSQSEQVSGPIGTAEVVSRAASVNIWAIIQVAVLLNLSLAFFNLMPIPALDGGRITLVLVGAIRGKPLSFSQEQAINMAGFAFIMLLMGYVVLRDLARFF